MKPPRRARPIGPQSLYRPTDTFETKVSIAERFLRDDICEEHRLFEIARKGESRFPQSGAIAYEIYQHIKTERQTAARQTFLERREADRAGLTLDEQHMLATVSMWGNLTVPSDDTRRAAIVRGLEIKGRVAVRRDNGRLIVTLAKAVSVPDAPVIAARVSS